MRHKSKNNVYGAKQIITLYSVRITKYFQIKLRKFESVLKLRITFDKECVVKIKKILIKTIFKFAFESAVPKEEIREKSTLLTPSEFLERNATRFCQNLLTNAKKLH